MISEITFDTPIGSDYKRNNRSTRQKSLRCFPSCGIKGHVSGGFCGLPLKVTIDVLCEPSCDEFIPGDYRYIAEIRPESSAKISEVPYKSISEEELSKQIRHKYDKNESTGEIFEADASCWMVKSISGRITTMELTFNSQHCSWDYAWKSNRWNGPYEKHVVDIIVLKKELYSADNRVVSHKSSPPFLVSSSHKKPTKINQIKDEDDDNEQICLPASNKTVRRKVPVQERDVIEDSSRMSNLNTSNMTSRAILDNVGEEKPIYDNSDRFLKLSEDGKTMEIVSSRSENEQEVQDASAALMLIGALPARKERKEPVSNKRAKLEVGPPPTDTHQPFPYYPYPFPYYPYPPYPPPSEAEVKDMYKNFPGYPPPGLGPSYPPMMYHPYPPYPMHPPRKDTQQHPMVPPPMYGMGMATYGMPPPGYPPHHGMHHMPYPHMPMPEYHRAGSVSSAKTVPEYQSSDEGAESEVEEARSMVNPTGSSSSSSSVVQVSALPIAVLVDAASVALPSANASVPSGGEHKVLKFSKRTNRFGGGGGGGGAPWDGRVVDGPSTRPIPPLESSRISAGASSLHSKPQRGSASSTDRLIAFAEAYAHNAGR